MYEKREDWQRDLSDEAPAGVLGQTLRNLVVLVVVCLGVAWLASGLGRIGLDRVVDEPRAVGRPVTAGHSAAPGATEQVADELVVPAAEGGHFLVQALSGGVPVRFLVDTGATRVILTTQDAERLGFNLRALEYSQSIETANGVIRAAPVTLADLRIGPLSLEEVEATVADSALGISLLGLSFLDRLEGFEVRDDRLVLRW